MHIQRVINSKFEYRASDLRNYPHRHSKISLTWPKGPGFK
jgi:hypothetical protein